jgi:hypothetical protein
MHDASTTSPAAAANKEIARRFLLAIPAKDGEPEAARMSTVSPQIS